MSDLLALPMMTPQPQCILTLAPQPNGTMGVNVSLVGWPGGWETAHQALCQALHLAAAEWAKVHHEQPMVLIPTLPAQTG